MRFAFNDEQRALQESARKFLENANSVERVLTLMETPTGFDPNVWKQLSAELGWTALTIPEAFGGYGLSHADLTPLMEEMGRSLLCAPFFSTLCLGANALLLGGSPEQKQTYLPSIASGALTATLAWQEPDSPWQQDPIQATVIRDGASFILKGHKAHVVDGHTAGLLIIAARSPNTTGDAGVSLFLVPADTPGLVRTHTPTLDQTRKQATLQLDNLHLPESHLLGPWEDGAKLLTTTRLLAGVALAAEQVGAAERCLDTTVQYAKDRVQFGRPIGSFQAIKHKCADMMVQVESARSAAWYAAWVASHNPSELPSAAAIAQAFCSEALFHCAAESVQIHGGIGFTWEHETHLYFKRAQSSRTLLGTPQHHREHLAREIGL